MCLVQLCIILVGIGMLYEKSQIIIFGYHFLLCNRYCVYVLMIKKIDKILTHIDDALCKKYNCFFIARDVQLDNRVKPLRS